GEFEESEFVRTAVGVGNVCERSCTAGPPAPNMLSYNLKHHSEHNPHPINSKKRRVPQNEMYTSAREMFWQVGQILDQNEKEALSDERD
uniref:cobalamin biosynthesis protein n=1 Tax=Enterocloster clostridioformis TaxID=1531 RepID=UPI001A9AE1E6